MSPTLIAFGSTDVGRSRDHNEDSFLVADRGEGRHLLVVCDGMGGHGGGEIASAVAVEAISAALPEGPLEQPPRAIYQALTGAHHAVIERARTTVRGMGTTAAVAWVDQDRCWVGWVGDSPFYRFRGGAILDRTEDHTRVRRMVEQGLIHPEQARTHPEAHILTMAIGGSSGHDGLRPSVWNEPLALEPGDVLLACSDGLVDLFDDQEIYPWIAGLQLQEAVARLISEANARGGHDNITVVLAICGGDRVPPLPAELAARAATMPEEEEEEELTPIEPTVPMQAIEQPSARRWLRILLPALAVLLALSCLIGGWVLHRMNADAPQLEAEE